MMIVFRLEKSHCLLKSSVPLLSEPKLIKKLASGAITGREIAPNTGANATKFFTLATKS